MFFLETDGLQARGSEFRHIFSWSRRSAGYGYDFVDGEALREEFSVAGGRLTTRSGMSYRVLYRREKAHRWRCSAAPARPIPRSCPRGSC
jgi:hypothetical protein